jgi:hypothetical protein
MLNITGVSVGHDVGDSCLGGRLDKLAVCIAGRSGGDSDDKKLLILEDIDDGGLIFVVDGGDNNALGEFVGAVFAREGSDSMFSSFHEGSSENRANSTSGLVLLLVSLCNVFGLRGRIGGGFTYTNNGDSLNGVGEAGG